MVPEELLRDKRLDTKEKMVLIVLLFHRHSKNRGMLPGNFYDMRNDRTF